MGKKTTNKIRNRTRDKKKGGILGYHTVKDFIYGKEPVVNAKRKDLFKIQYPNAGTPSFLLKNLDEMDAPSVKDGYTEVHQNFKSYPNIFYIHAKIKRRRRSWR
jgi:hypothetical protein